MPFIALVKRELLTNLRKHRSFLCVVLLVGICALAVALLWPRAGMDVHRVNHYSEMGRLSRYILAAVSLVVLTGCGLFVPAYGCSAILADREQGTSDMLQLTLISPRGMLFGKLINTLGLFALMAAGAIPILGLTFFLVGVDWVQLSLSGLIILQSMITAALLGMLSGALCRKPFFALGLSYISAAQITLLPILFGLLLHPRGAAPWYVFISPVFTLAELVFDGFNERAAITFFFVHPILCILCGYATPVLLRRSTQPARVESKQLIDDETLLLERRKTFPFYLFDPLRRKDMIEDGRNPMRVKELRWGLMGRETRMIRIFYGLVIFLFASGVAMSWTCKGLFWWLTLQILAVILFTPVVLANAFSKEQVEGNLDMLRVTLLRPRDIILGKVLAGWLSMLPFLLAMMAAGLPIMTMTIIWGDGQGLCLQAYGTLWVCAFLSLSLSLFGPILAKRMAGALTLTFLLTLFAYIGAWIAAAPRSAFWHICRFVGVYPWYNAWDLEPPSSLFSPFAAYCASTIHAWEWNRHTARGLFWDKADVTWLYSMGLFFLISLALVALSIPLFRQLRMKAR